MKKLLFAGAIIGLLFTLNACKNDVKQENAADAPIEASTEQKVVKESKPVPEYVRNSVMVKAMSTPELTTFVSFAISTGVSDFLTNEEGPYTLIAPTSTAFKASDNMLRTFQHVDKQDSLKHIIGSHIIKEHIDSATMVNNIRSGNGSYTVTTHSGEKLTFKRRDLDIVVSDRYGNEATLGKSDITGGNGVVHAIDKVLILH